MKACRKCRLIVDEGNVCGRCGGDLTKDWQGYIIILDHTKSQIAKKIGIDSNGTYALRVR